MYEKPFSYSPPAYVPNDPSLRRNEYDGEGDYDYGMLGNIASGVGNLVDLPGSMVRDAISFSNPFDQLMTPLSSDNRTSGAEISRYWMGGDEDSGGNQMAGMVIDILTDPLMLASGGTMAAGRMGAKAASTMAKGAKGVGKAAKAAYDTAKSSAPKARIAKSLAPYADDYTKTTDRAAKAVGKFQEGQKIQQMNDGAYLGMPGAPRVQGLDEMGTWADAALDRAKSAQAELARRQAGFDRFTQANRIPMAVAESRPFISGAMSGARQFGQSAYGGIRGAANSAVDGARGLAGRALSGDRNAMMQAGAIGTNAASAMGGLNMSQEPSIEEMIASAIMEDPELGNQLLELLMAGQAQY